MDKRKVDAKTKIFMDFFSEQLGAKFIDADTGEELEPYTDEDEINGQR